MVEVTIVKFSPWFHPEILMGSPPSGGVKKERCEKASHFLDLNVNISKTVADTLKLLLITNTKSHIYALSTGIKIDHLELL